MFTGIITHIATVYEIQMDSQTSERRLTLQTYEKLSLLKIGDSLACNGICLTLIDMTSMDTQQTLLSFQVSPETVRKTTLYSWKPRTRINLERSLRMGDSIDGHLVFGHVDGMTVCVSCEPYGESRRLVFEIPAHYEPYIVAKGSLALDGVSLTVNHVNARQFDVTIIPHTLKSTNLGDIQCGDCVNFEIDMLARYVYKRLAS